MKNKKCSVGMCVQKSIDFQRKKFSENKLIKLHSLVKARIDKHNQRQMKIDIKDIILLFQKIQQEVNISYVSIVIFAAVDIDSICTLKIFSKLFKCQNIQYKVYPVTTYPQIELRVQQAKVYEKVKMFMFINCGGIMDLTQTWIVQQNQAQIFLFDVNKPINHKNLQSPDIKIVDDGFSQLQHCPTSQQIQKYEQLNQYELDEDQDYDDMEDQDQKVQGSPKRKKNREFKEKLRKHKNLIQKKIVNYYGRNFFGYPSSYSAYRMVKDLNQINNEYLWYAIIGMTSMYLEHKISKDMLNSLTQVYRHDSSTRNIQGDKQKGNISMKMGYQMPLLDHWSLYQSMVNSTYLMIHLHLWDDKGIDRLKQYIHRLGISLQDAKQLFKYMPKESQTKIQNQIMPTSQNFKLFDIVYTSFQRQVDYSASFMASDYYYILTAVLENPPKIAMTSKQMTQYRLKCFWEAYDIFDGSLKQISKRIEDAKRMSKILISQAKNIMERDHIITMSSVSIANIHNDTDDKKMFQHPSALIRIAYLLMGILKQKKKDKTFKPVIANWIDTERQTCTVVGVMNDSKNHIGTRFTQIAERLKIKVNHSNFMSNIIMMKKDHLSEFIREIGQKV